MRGFLLRREFNPKRQDTVRSAIAGWRHQ